jgi:hypothetical protein
MSDNNDWPGKPGMPVSDELPYIFANPTLGQRAVARQSALYKKGDMSLVWMNQSALAELFLPKAEVDARIKYARKDALKEAARLARHYATIVPMHGSLKCDIYEAAGQAATEIAASIDALAESELPSEDIIRADRDAWPDYQANDPIRALKGEGDD